MRDRNHGQNHGQAALGLQNSGCGCTGKGRALLLPLGAKKIPKNPKNSSRALLLPANRAQLLIQVFYASLATLKTIPKTDKKRIKRQKKKTKQRTKGKAAVHVYLVQMVPSPPGWHREGPSPAAPAQPWFGLVWTGLKPCSRGGCILALLHILGTRWAKHFEFLLL